MIAHPIVHAGWNDCNVGAAVFSKPAASAPDEDNFRTGLGVDTGIATLAFAIGEKISGAMELPHDYQQGSNISFHVHWQGIAAPTGTDYVKWQLTYTWGIDEATPGAVATLPIETPFDTRYEFKRSDFPAITGTGFLIGRQMLFLLERIAADGDAYAGDALVATVGFHYLSDTLGSGQMGTK